MASTSDSVEEVGDAPSTGIQEMAEQSNGANYFVVVALLPEIVVEIVKHLLDVKDEVSMAETCPQWRHFFNFSSNWGSRAPPCLMSDRPENPEINSRHFVSLWNGKVFELELPAAWERRCWGSPHGWLATVGTDLGVELLNPISQARINLPPLPTIPIWPSAKIPGLIHKICILKINTHDPVKFLVVTILFPGDVLAYYWVNADGVDGHENWILANNPQKFSFHDVAYIRGKDQVYALCDNGWLVRINFGGTVFLDDQVELVAHLPPGEFIGNQLQNEKKGRGYLVDSDDAVFIVYRYSDDIGPDHKTLEFVLYKLNSDELGWEAVYNIEDKAIFVGNGNSWSISQASAVNCKNNNIYFVDDNLDHDWALVGGIDIGVYNIETCFTDSINFGVEETSLGPCSTWITLGLIHIPTFDA